MQFQFRRINDDVLDAFAFPSVGDVNQAVACLDHGGISEAVGCGRVIFQHQRDEPIFSVRRNRDVQRTAAFVVAFSRFYGLQKCDCEIWDTRHD